MSNAFSTIIKIGARIWAPIFFALLGVSHTTLTRVYSLRSDYLMTAFWRFFLLCQQSRPGRLAGDTIRDQPMRVLHTLQRVLRTGTKDAISSATAVANAV